VGWVLGGWDRSVESELDLAPGVGAFTRAALEDGLIRAESAFAAPAVRLDPGRWLDDARERVLALGVEQLVTLEAPVGAWRHRLDVLAALLEAHDLRLVRVRRPWDQTLWPGATGGFFRFRQYAGARGRLRALVESSPRSPALDSAA
jgi:deoxyribodipyrimidine photo-lyase